MSRNKEDRIPDWMRRAVLKRDHYRCRYCGGDEKPFHMDHVYPVSKGGETSTANLVTACAKCNQAKSAKVGIWPLPIDTQIKIMESNLPYLEKLNKQDELFGAYLDQYSEMIVLLKEEKMLAERRALEQEKTLIQSEIATLQKEIARIEYQLTRRTRAAHVRFFVGASGLALFGIPPMLYQKGLISMGDAIPYIIAGAILILVGYGMAHMMSIYNEEL